MPRTVDVKYEHSIIIDESLSITMQRQEYIDGEHEGERHYIGTPETRGASPGDVAVVEKFIPEMKDVAVAVWATKGVEMNMPNVKPKRGR